MSHRQAPVRSAVATQLRRRESGSIRATVAAILSAAALAGMAQQVMAQEASSSDSKKDEALEEIHITGSRIVRKDIEANSPTLTISSETLENRTEFSVESALNELPQFIPALTGTSDINRQQQLGATSTRYNTNQIQFSAGNTVGATNVNLRGLGANRNLVLLNGKRLIPVNGTMSVDTASIPTAALQRVEVVTGGASSVYGADAVSGVVNFILKENFQGADINAQYGWTEYGGDNTKQISVLLGGNFADGRGNATIGLEAADASGALQLDRPWYRKMLTNQYGGFNSNNSFAAYEAGTSPVVINDPFFGSLAIGGLTFGTPSQAVVDQIFGKGPAAVSNTSTFQLNNDGTLFVPGDADGATRYDGTLDGLQYKMNKQNGQFVENNLLTRVASPLRRYSMFGTAHLDVNEHLTLYAQTLFSQTKTSSVFDPGLAFSYWGVLIPHGTGRNCTTVGVSGTNCQNADPLPANLARYGTWANVPTSAMYLSGGAAGLTCPATGGCTNTQAFPVPTELARLLDSRSYAFIGPPVSTANQPFVLDVPMKIFGVPRGTTNSSTNWQLITGARGDLGIKDWTYDLYTSFGNSQTIQGATGAVTYGRLRALAALPNYGRGATVEGNILPPGSANQNHPITHCTSGLPLFPSQFSGQISDDCVDAVVINPLNYTKMNQTVAEGSVQGGLFDLPAGELRFALGAGWRKNTLQFTPADILSQESTTDGAVGFMPLAGNNSGDRVEEGFTELLVPVLKDLPLVKHFNLELGYRYSDYKFAGNVSTWKALGDWALTSDFRLRGGYQKANRAPNLVELFQKDTDQVLFGPGDPCSKSSPLSWGANDKGRPATATSPAVAAADPTNGAKVEALCRAMMGPGATQFYTNDVNTTDFGFSFETAIVSGNEKLKSESSDTWTLGAVLRSPFKSPLSQFTVSVDYFKITVADAIGVVQLNSLYGGIYRHCFDIAFNPTMDPNNSFCQQVPRQQSNGQKFANPQLTYSNVGGIISQGIDLSFNWSAALSDMGIHFMPGRLSYSLNGNYMIKDARQAAPGEPFEEFTGLSGFGSFRWTVFNTFGWFNGPANVSLNWRHYPGTQAYSDFAGIDHRVRGISSYDIFDLAAGYSITPALQLRAGVQNLLNKQPPISDFNPGASGPGSSGYSVGTVASGAYDTEGRRYYVGVKMSL